MYFVLLYRFNPDAGYGEARQQEIFSSHIRYLKKLFGRNVLLMSGAYTEVNGGVVILDVSSREEAEAIAAEDPALSSSLYLGELHEWQVAFKRA